MIPIRGSYRNAVPVDPQSVASFPQWLKRRRQERDLTQDQLAELTGYATPTIQKIERGERKPSRDLAVRLAEALAIPHNQWDAFIRLARAPVVSKTPTPTAVPSPQSASLPLLRTHIQPPPLRRHLVPRQRLSNRLDFAAGGTITLLVAPAGWGKTTLLSAWVSALSAHDRQRVAWLALDMGETEPLRLLRYVIAALQQVKPQLGNGAQALLDTPQPALQAALMLLINDLAELPQSLALILDDYHALRTPSVHAILLLLVEHLPAQLHLIIASREDPPLPLSRLRARNQLHEIRAADLRFTHEEATSLLGSMGLELAPHAIAALDQRLEGWAAGLQLTALALRDQHDQICFIDSFVGSHRLALEYLAEEVLEQLPNHTLTFLLQTSILDRMCGPLCDAVMGVMIDDEPLAADRTHNAEAVTHLPSSIATNSYSRLLLEDIERANLFLVRLDETGTWYRYHHLFGALLRARLERGANPTLVRELHGRAARWYAAHHLWPDALAHAQHGEQWDIAAQALLVIGDDLMIVGAFDRLSGLIERLPEQVRAAHPRLLTLQGLCASKNYQYERSYRLLTQATALFETQGDQIGRSEALVHLADAQRSLGRYADAYATLQEALSSPLPPITRLNGLLSRSYEAVAAGDWQSAAVARDAALSLVSQHAERLLQFELALNGHPSIFLVLPGSVALAERFCRSVAQWDVPALSPVRAMLHWVEGYLHLLRGDPAAAIGRITEALHLSDQLGGLAKIDLDPGAQLVLLKGIIGDLEGANERMIAVNRALQHPSVNGFVRLFGAVYGYMRGWLAIQQGQFAEAHAVSREVERDAHGQEWPYSPVMRTLLRGLLAIEVGDMFTAQIELRSVVDQQHRFVDSLIVGDARMPLAYSLLRAGNERGALHVLADAFNNQIERGTPGILLLTGRRYAVPLLHLAHAHNLHAPLAERLLGAFGETGATRSSKPSDDLDALTSREYEVLQLLAHGAGNQHIADTLVISLHTAKKHVARILAKLGVENRTEAIIRARQRGLIS